MAWNTVPVTGAVSDVLKAQFDEVKAAINERQTACGLALTTAAASANGAQARTLLTTYRTAIDNLITHFVNPSNSYAAYTKSTCLTAALGAGRTDWLGTQVPAYMFADEINELRSVLNLLLWVTVTASAGATIQLMKSGAALPSGQSNASWNDSWAAAKSSYGASAWAADSGSGASYTVYANAPSNYVPGSSYEHLFSHYQVTDQAYAIADIAILDTKATLSCQYAQTGTAGMAAQNFDLCPQANFGGTAVTFTVDAGDIGGVLRTIDIADVVRNTTQHFSLRTNPATPTHDSYRPDDTNLSVVQHSAVLLALLVRFGFSYL